jgi:hypothetical protein
MSKEQLSSCYIGKTHNLEWQQFLTSKGIKIMDISYMPVTRTLGGQEF